MINNQIIKGEYFFDINIYTMFEVYNICTSNQNIITDNGIDFFLRRWITVPDVQYNEEDETASLIDDLGFIGYIGVGSSNEQPKSTDVELYGLTHTFLDTKAKVKNKELVLSVETDGTTLSGTTEIGVYTTNMVLVSRDVHTRYTLPTTATVKLTYKFTLNQTDKSEEDNIEEEYND